MVGLMSRVLPVLCYVDGELGFCLPCSMLGTLISAPFDKKISTFMHYVFNTFFPLFLYNAIVDIGIKR